LGFQFNFADTALFADLSTLMDSLIFSGSSVDWCGEWEEVLEKQNEQRTPFPAHSPNLTLTCL